MKNGPLSKNMKGFMLQVLRDIGLAKTIALIRLRIYDLLPRKIARENWFVGQIFEKSHKL